MMLFREFLCMVSLVFEFLQLHPTHHDSHAVTLCTADGEDGHFLRITLIKSSSIIRSSKLS